MTILDQSIQGYKKKLGAAAKRLLELTQKVEHVEMSEIASDLLSSIDDPFMFVIVGEVKVGKSSFINALLESKDEICKVAAHPMTDTIQVIEYGEKITETSIDPFLKYITHPADILKDISIVDTPGTNTIVERHQDITEDFIPKSDLVIFVFEAKNPYRHSAWEFFKYIQKDWHKKLVFVLQQKDLMDEDDLRTNISGVRDYAVKQGVESPLVFDVSAKLELEENKESSGFDVLRTYIKDRVTGGKAPILKLLSKINTGDQVSQRLSSGIDDRKKQWDSDQVFRADIKDTLDQHQTRSNDQVTTLVTNILDSYDSTTLKAQTELSDGLGFFSILKKSISSIFDKEQNPKNWLDRLAKDLEKSLNLSMKEKLGKGVRDISESLQQMAQIVQLKIQQSETILKDDHDIFSRIADKRARILSDLQDAFNDFLGQTENFYPSDMLEGGRRLSPNVATGTGIAVLGAMLTALTHGVVFDVTGGVITAVGLIFAGASLGFHRRKLLKRYKKEVEDGRNKLEDQVTTKLKSYVDHIREKIDQTFSKFDAHLENEKKEITVLVDEQSNISEILLNLKNEIEKQYQITL